MSLPTIELRDSIKILEKLERKRQRLREVTDTAVAIDYMEYFVVPGVRPPLTEWQRRRNDRIYEFLNKHDEFTIREFHLYVWRERLLLDERYHSHKPLATFMDSPLSTFIRNFTRYLIWELIHAGILEEETYNGTTIYKVIRKPSKDLIYEICSYRDPY